ncbi:MAG: HAD family phosphatase [Flavobacteriaceae bacterium]|nr:HAD family phosphatase [Flavobacteriaceae bacterium]
MAKIDTIIFDLGGVLVDWNPRYVYNQVFKGNTEKVSWFLNTICTPEWNVQQDAGKLMAVATEELVAQYPQYEEWIRLYYDRWGDMLKGEIPETVKLLKDLKASNKYRLYALTNWSAETFHIALERFDFLQLFEGILVSGAEKMAKPDKAIYELCLSRFDIDRRKAIFIDDSLPNVKAAEAIGLKSIHFKNAGQLNKGLKAFEIADV